MQLHQLARVILVQSLAHVLLVGLPRCRHLSSFRRQRVRAEALCIVKVHKHRRTVRNRFKQVFEPAQRAGANRVALIAHQVIRHLLVLAQIHVEVIQPEIRHHFLELCRRVNVAREPRGDQLFTDYALRAFKRRYGQLEFGA